MKNRDRPHFSRFAGRLVVCVAIAGCGSSGPRQDPAFDRQLADAVRASASEAAVTRPGAKICRAIHLGIAERDWIRGVVQSIDAGKIRVRIDDPGRFPASLNGTQLARGVLVEDRAAAWTPCAF